jgi:hypothetical protein
MTSRAGRNDAGFWLECQLRDNEYSLKGGCHARLPGASAAHEHDTNMKGKPEAYTEHEMKNGRVREYQYASMGEERTI